MVSGSSNLARLDYVHLQPRPRVGFNIHPRFNSPVQGLHYLPTWTRAPSRGLSPLIARSSSQERRLIVHEVDPDLWEVLEICDNEELHLIHRILFSRNPFSPLIKNLVTENDPIDVQLNGRDSIMFKIQNQFQFLAASSLQTIRGIRPTYRDTLLHIRSKFGVKCQSTLQTQDLESEIYLFLLEHCEEFLSQESKAQEVESAFADGDGSATSSPNGSKPWSGILTPLRLGRDETMSMISKFGSAVTVSALRSNVLRNLGRQIVTKQFRYQLALRAVFTQGKRNLQKTIAVQAAQRNVSVAVARYSTVKGALSLLGPVLWAWFVADVALKSIGTDYARIVNVVFSLAQVRLIKTHGFSQPKDDPYLPDQTNNI